MCHCITPKNHIQNLSLVISSIKRIHFLAQNHYIYCSCEPFCGRRWTACTELQYM